MTTVTTAPEPTSRAARFRQQNGWVVGVAVLLLVMILVRYTQVENFGGFELRALTAGSLMLALLALAQGVVVISGGINLAVGALMVLANCVSAWLMEDASFGASIAVALGTVVGIALLSGLMGWVITVSGLPDIVVTLALHFAFVGLALLILGGPGGAANPELSRLIVGGFSNPWPSLLWLTVIFCLVWIPFRRSRAGIATYAIGSDRQAAFLAGVVVRRTRVQAYVVSGVFAGLAGLVTTALLGSGSPQESIALGALLGSVAAVVLGGVALSGGRGQLLGPVLAAFVLTLIPPILLSMGINPNVAVLLEGLVIIGVVMLGGLLELRRRTR
ncbi:ABC transporter permease [Georgenia satyanarayanai]|uniref:ABC transporter permease n=1 Tax=Georgenia satyanarayanai TaxID=860221 RepID=UPI0012651D0C|nr:ABC transporter permease [Georgenia satyanarayanai]